MSAKSLDSTKYLESCRIVGNGLEDDGGIYLLRSRRADAQAQARLRTTAEHLDSNDIYARGF
jgi:hypothetical protein